MMRSLSIGILNWIGVYPRPCIFSKISKLVSMYWIRNLIRSSLISFLNSELDLLLSEVIHMFKNVKSAKLDRVLCHDGEPPLLGYGILLAYNVDDCKSWSAILLSSQPIC
jgi:hypothetical protein